ncbi:MAG: SCO family protein [Gammaproteobacteria bacterium]|nr:SCO family protein [Gammaproteobacteria bacterium]
MNTGKIVSLKTGFALLFIILAFGAGVMRHQTAKSDAIPDEVRGLLIEQPVTVPDFKLADQQNRVFNAERLKGVWTFMFFGYTHCPDICPTTLTELDDAASRLTELQTPQRKIQYVFISVDPERDTPELLADYINYFDARFIAATGPVQDLKQLTEPLGVKFERGAGAATEYLVGHSSAMLLIDPQARYYARFAAPHYSEEIVEGFKQVLSYAERQQ